MEDKGLKRFLINIWPRIYRIINGTLYFIMTVIKSIVSMAIKQLRNT